MEKKEAMEIVRKLYSESLFLKKDKEAMVTLIPELKEDEDERMFKVLREGFNILGKDEEWYGGITNGQVLAWLEKQGNLVKYYEDKLDRCACDNFNKGYKKALEKQGVQKSADKVEPKFKIGDYVKNTNDKREPIYEIVYVDKECYICEYRGKENIGDKAVMHFSFDNPYLHLVQNPTDKVEPKFHEGEWITIKQ